MKVQKKMFLGGKFARTKEDINQGDILEILDEGRKVPSQWGERDVFKVLTLNGDRILTFNPTSMNYLIDAYGDETQNWVGKKVKVWLIKSNVGGKMRNVVYLTHPAWVETQDGFGPPEKIKDEDIPVIEDKK